MASQAACFTTAGAGKSGKPWARFTAWCAAASRVISRMTDSVNGRVRSARKRQRVSAGCTRAPGDAIQSPIDVSVSQYDLDVVAGLGERNRLDELRGLAVFAPREPTVHS